MATDPQTLTAQGSMYSSQTALQWQWMKLALLAQTLQSLNPMAAIDPGSLQTISTPYSVYPPQTLQLFELALLAQIAGSLASAVQGGTTCSNYGGSSPVSAPAAGCGFTIDTSNGHIWVYLNGHWKDSGLIVGA